MQIEMSEKEKVWNNRTIQKNTETFSKKNKTGASNNFHVYFPS